MLNGWVRYVQSVLIGLCLMSMAIAFRWTRRVRPTTNTMGHANHASMGMRSLRAAVLSHSRHQLAWNTMRKDTVVSVYINIIWMGVNVRK